MGGRSRLAGLRRPTRALALLGLLLFTGVIAGHGAGEVARALGSAGWALALLVPFHLGIVAVDAQGWRVLFASPRPPLGRLVRLRWIGESVNQLLPVAQVGGDLVKARLLTMTGVEGSRSGAAVVVALTTAGLTQALFGLAGVGLLLGRLGRHQLLPALLGGVGVLGGSLVLFYRLQRRGLFAPLARGLTRVAGGRRWLRAVGGAEALDRAVEETYRRRGSVAASASWHFAGWVLGTGEVWLAMYLLGAPVSLGEALLLESLGQAVRGAAFPVPGALGVQEGAYVLLGSVIGLAPALALALSLAKRVRELLLGVPGLVAWQLSEGLHLARRRRKAEAEQGP